MDNVTSHAHKKQMRFLSFGNRSESLLVTSPSTWKDNVKSYHPNEPKDNTRCFPNTTLWCTSTRKRSKNPNGVQTHRNPLKNTFSTRVRKSANNIKDLTIRCLFLCKNLLLQCTCIFGKARLFDHKYIFGKTSLLLEHKTMGDT